MVYILWTSRGEAWSVTLGSLAAIGALYSRRNARYAIGAVSAPMRVGVVAEPNAVATAAGSGATEVRGAAVATLQLPEAGPVKIVVNATLSADWLASSRPVALRMAARSRYRPVVDNVACTEARNLDVGVTDVRPQRLLSWPEIIAAVER